MIDLWLHGRSPHTQRAYEADLEQFRAFVDAKPLCSVTLGDLQAFADHLEASNLKPASRHRKLSGVKSILAFAHRIGYLAFDVGRALRMPSVRDNLAQRILTEAEVRRMIALEPKSRNRVILLVLYASGIRVSELCTLTFADIQERTGGCQLTVFGKRGKTRTILLPAPVAVALNSLRLCDSSPATPVFKGRRGSPLAASQVMRVVRSAARQAGIDKKVSPHWLRHGHASHSLDRGAPISLVQATLGHASVATTGRYLHARPTDSSSRYLDL